MLSWLNGGKSRPKPDHITIEPIFDKDPPLYLLYPHAKLPGSTAPKVWQNDTSELMNLVLIHRYDRLRAFRASSWLS